MIKLTELNFDEVGFRGLSELKIKISPRITIVAGHNGIGKSTILGLIANGSELKGNKTILKTAFRSEFSEIFYLDYEEDYSSREKGASRAQLVYEIFDEDSLKSITIVKECKVSASHKIMVLKNELKPFMHVFDESDLSDAQNANLPQDKEYVRRMRIIPRTKEIKADDEELIEKYSVGSSAKMSVPTLYIGMSRISPIGEFDWGNINHRQLRIDDSISSFIYNFFDSVIPFSRRNNTVYGHSFSKSNKKSVVPDFGHSSLTISLGQDSLSSIATAIASFNSIKNELKEDYKGGILVIDEIEAGLHPRAQKNLIDQLKKFASILNLQIIMTSHSLTVIKEVIDHENYNPAIDGIVYITDTRVPKVMENPTYLKIKNDMLLKTYSSTETVEEIPTIEVYFEDEEAVDFINGIFESLNISNTHKAFGKRLNLNSASLGCSVLLNLSASSEHFTESLIIVDSDTTDDVKQGSDKTRLLENNNVLILPVTDENSAYYKMPPDRIAYYFLYEKYINADANRSFWHDNTSNLLSSDYFAYNMNDLKHNNRKLHLGEEESISDFVKTKFTRNEFKKWYKEHRSELIEFKIFKLWADENPEYCQDFVEKLSIKVDQLS